MQTAWMAIAVVAIAAFSVGAEPEPAATSPAPASPAAATPLSDEARAILQMLQDRKATLKDFTCNVDYAVENMAGDLAGKLGTLNYTDDGKLTKFIFDFTVDTFEGKPTHKHHTVVASDGVNITVIDYAAKQFQRFPAPTNSLQSPIPIPLGIKVQQVTDNFNVEERPAGKDLNLTTLRLTPRLKGRFDYAQLDLTVDKKLQIPVKVVVYTADEGQITTVKFLSPEINTGKAAVPFIPVPSVADGWTVKITPAGGGGGPATLPAK